MLLRVILMLNFLNFVITDGLPWKVMTDFPLVRSRYSGRFIRLVKSPSKSDFMVFKKCFWFINPFIIKGVGEVEERGGDEATFLNFFKLSPEDMFFLVGEEGGRETSIMCPD